MDNIVKIVVLLTDGADSISVHIDSPSPMPKVSKDKLSMDFRAEANTGVDYVKRVFGIEPEVIDIRRSVYKFSKN
jgi:hypothetical protein